MIWLLKAAKQGDLFGERELAICYLFGAGVHQNDRKAFNWFYSAARLTDPAARDIFRAASAPKSLRPVGRCGHHIAAENAYPADHDIGLWRELAVRDDRHAERVEVE